MDLRENLQPTPRSEFAIRLIGEMFSASRCGEAATACATALAQQFGFDRVSVGLFDAHGCQVVGRSHALDPDARSLANTTIADAMAEAVEQGTTIVVPGAESRPSVVTRAHVTLLREVAGLVTTIPLAVRGTPVAAITLQSFRPRTIDRREIEVLEHLTSFLAPALHLMRQNERPWRQRVMESLREWRDLLQSEDGRRPRQIVALAGGVAAVLLLVPLHYEVGAEARVEGEIQRIVAAPADGFLKTAHVRAGDAVHAGQLLAELVDQDLLLERERWASQLRQHETAYATAMARTDRAQAAIDLSRATEAQAQLALADTELSRAQIVAPFDGVVIHGDLTQSLGGPVKQGQALFTLAPARRFRVIVEVDERDIAQVAVGQHGSLALSALPWNTLPVEVVRLAPMATPLEGRNVFEVEARLLETRDGLRPGLRGHASIEAGRQPVAWTWIARVASRVRFALWRWLA